MRPPRRPSVRVQFTPYGPLTGGKHWLVVFTGLDGRESVESFAARNEARAVAREVREWIRQRGETIDPLPAL